MRPARWTRSTILWIAVLSIMAGFQLWRGAFVDGVLFSAIVAVLVIDRASGGNVVIIRRAADAPRAVIIAVAAGLGAVMALAPRHSTPIAVAMGVAGALALVLAWNPAGTRPERPMVAYRRSALTWSLLGVALCVWEAAAFIASVTIGGNDFPTISVLLDPALDISLGRVLFTGLWIVGGLSLINVWRKR